MTPKVTYVINAATEEIVFTPDQYSLFTQEWERDEIEYKHPFTGEKTRRLRGYYYKGTLAFDAAPYDLLESYRDLFSVATTDIRFFPNKDEKESYEVDANENISAEDSDAALAVKNFEIVFRSKKRFDSALNYPSTFWGARRLAFSDSPAMTTHRTELNAADDANLADHDAVAADVAAHVQGTGLLHSVMHYTKAEVDAALDAIGKRIVYEFGVRIVDLDDAAIQQQDPVVYQSVRMLPFKTASVVGTTATIGRDGTITKIAMAWEGTPTTHHISTVAFAVTKGQRLTVGLWLELTVDVGWVNRIKVFVDGVQVLVYAIGTDISLPYNASVVILQE